MKDYMKEALVQARKAFSEGEVPIGAVIVRNGEIISSSHNLCQTKKDSTMHAEMNAIKEAMEKLNQKVLDECDLYVTVEPCPMCAGAIGLSRIKRVYIGCEEPKTGSFGSVININDKMPWKTEVYIGFHEDECKEIMKVFFENKR